MTKYHHYTISVTWTGNNGAGTASYHSYERDFEADCDQKSMILGSADPAFRGDGTRWNPEELLVASLSSCHQLWYLHLCADAGLVVTGYRDNAHGTVCIENRGRFKEVVLRPKVVFASAVDPVLARELHEEAHKRCFIANSVNFPVRCMPDESP